MLAAGDTRRGIFGSCRGGRGIGEELGVARRPPPVARSFTILQFCDLGAVVSVWASFKTSAFYSSPAFVLSQSRSDCAKVDSSQPVMPSAGAFVGPHRSGLQTFERKKEEREEGAARPRLTLVDQRLATGSYRPVRFACVQGAARGGECAVAPTNVFDVLADDPGRRSLNEHRPILSCFAGRPQGWGVSSRAEQEPRHRRASTSSGGGSKRGRHVWIPSPAATSGSWMSGCAPESRVSQANR